MRARITVTLKTGVLDPQGKAIESALASMGITGIAGVRQGKLFDVDLVDGERAAVEPALRQACERLLANTVIENYRIEFDADAAHSRPAQPAPAPDPEAAFAPDQAVPAAVAPPPLDLAAATEIAARDTDIPTEGHP